MISRFIFYDVRGSVLSRLRFLLPTAGLVPGLRGLARPGAPGRPAALPPRAKPRAGQRVRREAAAMFALIRLMKFYAPINLGRAVWSICPRIAPHRPSPRTRH